MKTIFFLCLLTASMLNADSINSSLKNPSMAVTGTQRPATNITANVILVADLGTTCNSNVDTLAVTPDHGMVLICYSNIWVQAAVDVAH